MTANATSLSGTLSGFIAAALAGAGTLHTAQMDGHTRGADQQHARHAQDSILQDITRAVAVIRPTEGNDGVSGTIRFERVEDGVRVTALVRGLKPNSKHGFHAHEFGDATKPDGTSAGSHFDPAGSGHHARPGAGDAHHAGDFGNLEADAQGVARYDRTFESLTIGGSKAPVLGRAVVVHAEADEFDQPTGSAGARIGIGVIGVANPEGFGRSLWE